jgi:hypothetical protein
MSNTKKKMMNTLPDIADDNGNNCPVAINYVNKYIIIVLQIVNFSFFWQADKNYHEKIVNMYVLIHFSI